MSFSWSYSSLNAFETCPFRYYMTRVTKKVVEPESDEIKWGNRVHKALELRVKGEAPLPDYLQQHERLVAAILQREGETSAERKLAIDERLRPCGWFDKNAWCRGVIDVGKRLPRVGFIGDWKTGKRKPDSFQMQLMAALEFAHHPELEQVGTAFIWLKENKIDAEVFTTTQVPHIWQQLLARVVRLQLAYEKEQWHKRPSGLCGKWCPVTKRDCEFGRD